MSLFEVYLRSNRKNSWYIHIPHGHCLLVSVSLSFCDYIQIRLTKLGTAFLEWDFLCPRLGLPPAKPYAYITLANCTMDSPKDGCRDFLVDFLDLRAPDFLADFLPLFLETDLRLPADFLLADRLAPDFLPFPFLALPPNRDWPLSDTPSICCASCLTSSDTA